MLSNNKRTSLTFILLILASAANADVLPVEVERVLVGHGIPLEQASIVVQSIDSGEVVLEHLSDVPRNPASVMKLVTTWAALEILGPAYRWHTEVHYLGEFDGRKLDGDLAFKGHGDPYLVLEEFWKLLRAVRQTGLSDVSGDLLLDDSYFDVVEEDPGEFDGQPYRTYNVLPNAMLVNFKAVYFRFSPDPAGERVDIVVDPPLRNLQVDNRLELHSNSCGGFQRGISFNPSDPSVLDRVIFDGRFSARCRTYGMSRTVLQHDTYTLGLFQMLWSEMGGGFTGTVRSVVIGDDREPTLVWPSRPLGEVIRSINKNSNNVMTRQLLYTLGAEQLGVPGTREHGVEIVTNFLDARGLDTSSLILRNGAGLSRESRISARLMADILLAAERGPYAAEFVASLSLGGIDGTTRGRFDRASGSGRMHVKSGRLDHVSALAGYWHAANGGDYVVAIMLNSEDAHRGPGQELEEAVLYWLNSQSG
jgi:D-alanyl-D-alanine carboxypeptidase/D-alanyl-D-alanine-endopeptidase (penicillin-binding protein 4)